MKEITIFEAFTGDVFNDFTECLEAEFIELQYENRISCYSVSFEKKIIELDDLRNHNVEFIFIPNLLDVTVQDVFENLDTYEDIPMPHYTSCPYSDLFVFDYALEGWRRAEAVLDEAKYKLNYLEKAIKNCK